MIKEKQIEKIAQTWTDEADLDALEEFFYKAQKEYLESLDEQEFEGILADFNAYH